MVLRPGQAPEHRRFYELPEILDASDMLVWNESRVEPRRLFLERNTGARIEALFLEHRPTTDLPRRWACMMRNIQRVQNGEFLIEPSSGVEFQFFRGQNDVFLSPPSDLMLSDFLEAHGQMPIPPYLNRPEMAEDRIRYQTVYAQTESLRSSAAPTAGLHFTDNVIRKIKDRSIPIVSLQLSVGTGTFAPLSEENLQQEKLHPETYYLPEQSVASIEAHKGRLISVGTTTLRALESNYRLHGRFKPGQYETTAFFRPPQTIGSIQGLITNFHLPGSSLLMLVCAFGGTDRIMQAYKEAIDMKYRFYSYGDAMLVFA